MCVYCFSDSRYYYSAEAILYLIKRKNTCTNLRRGFLSTEFWHQSMTCGIQQHSNGYTIQDTQHIYTKQPVFIPQSGAAFIIITR